MTRNELFLIQRTLDNVKELHVQFAEQFEEFEECKRLVNREIGLKIIDPRKSKDDDRT